MVMSIITTAEKTKTTLAQIIHGTAVKIAESRIVTVL